MNALEIKNLCKTYPGFTLDHLNLTLPQGCIMGLIGENGAGKSTTIRLILDMIRSDGGTVKLFGKDIQGNIRELKEDIGVVLDEVGFPECMNASRIGVVMRHTFRNWEEDVYQGYLSRLSIPKDKEFKDLSRGMKMKLGIAMALSHRAKLLILDEATAGLDPLVRDELLDIFLDFTRDEEHSILISSHIVSDLEKICDYVAFLHKGKLLLCEEKDLLKEQYGIVHCTRKELETLPKDAVKGKRESAYGVEAVVRRSAAAGKLEVTPVNIEELFISMVKGESEK